MGPRRKNVPTLEPLAAPQSEQERKERQRLHVKRTYYKKLNAMQAQRDRVRQLEEEYARLVAAKRGQSKTSSTQPSSPDVVFLADEDVTTESSYFFDTNIFEGANAEPQDTGAGESAKHPTRSVSEVSNNAEILPRSGGGLQSMREMYLEISELKEQLLAENEAMRTAINEYEQFAQRVSSFIELEELDAEKETTAPYRTAVLREPMTLEFCQDFARTAYAEMRQYRLSQGFLTTGVSVFGWRDKRLPVGDRVKFSLKKTLPGRNALATSLRAWTVLSMPKPLESLFSPTSNCRFSTVQVIDDDNKIMFRLMTSPDGSMLAKTLFMVTRFAIPNGYVIFIQSIDPKLLEPSELPVGVVEKWVEHSTWVTFEEAGEDGQHCRLEFSGELQINPIMPGIWLLEVLFIILRFEAKLTGPVFSLC